MSIRGDRSWKGNDIEIDKDRGICLIAKLPFSSGEETEMGKTIVDKQFDERERKKTGGRRGNFSIFYNLVEFV